jgi:DNA-binding GntR family transcriptional regulator
MGPAEPVVDALRAAIIAGDFAPGEQLRQATVAERFGVSRIPVREALRALAAEGLLCHAPNRGYFVKKLDVAEMEQLYWMRGLLEQRVLQTATRPCPRLL